MLLHSTVLQGVRELYEIKELQEDAGDLKPKLVLIGRNLPPNLSQSFLDVLHRDL